MDIVEVFALFNNKFKEIEKKYENNLDGLKEDQEYVSLTADFGKYIKYCTSRLSDAKQKELLDKFTNVQITTKRRREPVALFPLNPPGFFARDYRNAYENLILSDEDFVYDANLDLANELLSLQSINVLSEREKNEKIAYEMLEAAKQEYENSRVVEITYELTVNTYIKKLDNYDKNLKNPNEHGIRAKKMIQDEFFGVAEFVKGCIDNNNFNEIVDKLDIENEDKEILKRFNKEEILSNRKGINALLTNKEVINQVSNDFKIDTTLNIFYVDNIVSERNKRAREKYDEKQYKITTKYGMNYAQKVDKVTMLERDNDNFLASPKRDVFSDYSMATMQMFAAASGFAPLISAERIAFNQDIVLNAKRAISYLTNKNNRLNNPDDVDFRNIAFNDTVGTKEYNLHFKDYKANFTGVNDKNIDMIVEAIATVKINHMNRPLYQRFFGYFGKIGDEMKQADLLASAVAREFNVDHDLLLKAVNEKAGLEDKSNQNGEVTETNLEKLRKTVNHLELNPMKEEQVDTKNVYKYEDLTKDDILVERELLFNNIDTKGLTEDEIKAAKEVAFLQEIDNGLDFDPDSFTNIDDEFEKTPDREFFDDDNINIESLPETELLPIDKDDSFLEDEPNENINIDKFFKEKEVVHNEEVKVSTQFMLDIEEDLASQRPKNNEQLRSKLEEDINNNVISTSKQHNKEDSVIKIDVSKSIDD